MYDFIKLFKASIKFLNIKENIFADEKPVNILRKLPNQSKCLALNKKLKEKTKITYKLHPKKSDEIDNGRKRQYRQKCFFFGT